MIVPRNNLPILANIFQRISNAKFNIDTQYKLLKLKKAIAEEEEIYEQQLEQLKEYCLRDENGNLVRNDEGGYAIDTSKTTECEKLVKQINSIQIQIPDIYFSLDELASLDLTFNELEALDHFIK